MRQLPAGAACPWPTPTQPTPQPVPPTPQHVRPPHGDLARRLETSPPTLQRLRLLVATFLLGERQLCKCRDSFSHLVVELLVSKRTRSGHRFLHCRLMATPLLGERQFRRRRSTFRRRQETLPQTLQPASPPHGHAAHPQAPFPPMPQRIQMPRGGVICWQEILLRTLQPAPPRRGGVIKHNIGKDILS